MQIAVLGIDLGKNSCSLVGLDGQGKVVKRRRMRPTSVVGFTKSLPPCIIAMEACCGAHHLGRLLEVQGHDVRLMSPEYVRTGGKPRLVGITKRGNCYLRKLLIHGARAVLPTLSKSETPLGGWLRALLARVHKNAAVVALANKLARIAWAVLRRKETFNPSAMALA
jgi:transposase